MVKQKLKLWVDDADLAALCHEWKVTELAVFGSAARGEMTPESDVDLLVTFSKDARWSLWDLVAIQDDFARLFQRKVDLVESGTVRNPYRRASIERDARVVYAA